MRNRSEGVASFDDDAMSCLRLLLCQDLNIQLRGTSHQPVIISVRVSVFFFNHPSLFAGPKNYSSLFSRSPSLQLVLKVQTQHGVEHHLEACSREERDRWAGDITAVVDKLRGSQVATEDEPDGSRLHNFNLG